MRQVLRRAAARGRGVPALLAGCSTEVVVGQASPGPASRSTSAPRTSRSPASATAGSTSSPATRSPTSRPSGPSRLSGVLRRGVHAAGERLLLGRLRGGRSTAPTPRPASAARARRPPRTRSPATRSTTPPCDLIAYDRALLEELSTEYGRFLVPVVMAHEFGHAMQGRFGFSERGIQDETQADCLAGAWTGWVAAGESEHVSLRTPELDDVLRGFLLLRDDVGSDPDDTQAHGSYFDRVSAFYEGFDGGVAPCRDDFGAGPAVHRRRRSATTRVRRARATRTSSDIVDWIADDAAGVLGRGLPVRVRQRLRARRRSRASTAPRPTARVSRTATSATAPTTPPSTSTRPTSPTPAYDEIGDFALATAMSLPYSLAVRDQAGLSIDDGAATRSAVCLTGWYEAQWYNGEFADVRPSARSAPATSTRPCSSCSTYGVDDEVFPNLDASGFELVGAFRTGFLEGGDACELAALGPPAPLARSREPPDGRSGVCVRRRRRCSRHAAPTARGSGRPGDRGRPRR